MSFARVLAIKLSLEALNMLNFQTTHLCPEPHVQLRAPHVRPSTQNKATATEITACAARTCGLGFHKCRTQSFVICFSFDFFNLLDIPMRVLRVIEN